MLELELALLIEVLGLVRPLTSALASLVWLLSAIREQRLRAESSGLQAGWNLIFSNNLAQLAVGN